MKHAGMPESMWRDCMSTRSGPFLPRKRNSLQSTISPVEAKEAVSELGSEGGGGSFLGAFAASSRGAASASAGRTKRTTEDRRLMNTSWDGRDAGFYRRRLRAANAREPAGGAPPRTQGSFRVSVCAAGRRRFGRRGPTSSAAGRVHTPQGSAARVSVGEED